MMFDNLINQGILLIWPNDQPSLYIQLVFYLLNFEAESCCLDESKDDNKTEQNLKQRCFIYEGRKEK